MGALLIYLTPFKHVKLELLTATALSTLSDIERILANAESNVEGIYLPPKRLKDCKFSLIFIPSKLNEALPKPEETSDVNPYSENDEGLFLTRAPKMRSTSMEPQRFRNWLPLQGINSVAFYSAFSWRFENRWTRACAILFSL